MKPALLIPVHQHAEPLAAVLEGLAGLGMPCFVIDDGSDAANRERMDELARLYEFVELHHCAENLGKGVALRSGFRLAAHRGYSHVIHLDADGQHATAEVPRFLDAMAAHPGALVLGAPRFDASVPRARLASRQLSRGLVWLATLSFAIEDPLVGFRGVPLEPTLALLDQVRTGDHMEFEPEMAVRLVWAGVPVVNLPTPIVYPKGGHSNFDILWDDLRLAWLYIRLFFGMLVRSPRLVWSRPKALAMEAGDT
ncbi:MAG: glycosyltransferase family 2 protein [bacterium]|nr:glycosyltransferase family 2 protein [bacterium]